MSFRRKSPRYWLVKIAVKRLIPASTMHEVGNASKKGSSAALSLGYLVTVLVLLQYSLRFLLLKTALAKRIHMNLIKLIFYVRLTHILSMSLA